MRGIDLEIQTGVITGLIGPNGAGKTTLINTWLGFERPTAGTATVSGLDQRDRHIPGRLNIGHVAQGSPLYVDLTVADHVALAVYLRPDFDRVRALRWADEAGLHRKARVGHLSGGQRAQLGLALAVGTRAPILLLDEPVASLDPLARGAFLSALGSIARDDGTTILISSHIVADLEPICRRVVVLAAGRIVLDAETSVLLDGHWLVSRQLAVSLERTRVVGPLPGDSGVVVVREGPGDPPSGSRPTLEQLVLGYLAAGYAPASDPRRHGRGR